MSERKVCAICGDPATQGVYCQMHAYAPAPPVERANLDGRVMRDGDAQLPIAPVERAETPEIQRLIDAFEHALNAVRFDGQKVVMEIHADNVREWESFVGELKQQAALPPPAREPERDERQVPTAWSGMLGDGHDYSRTGKHDPLNCRRCLQQANRALVVPREPDRDARDAVIAKLSTRADILEEWADNAEFAHKLAGPSEDEPLTPRFDMFAPETRELIASMREAVALLGKQG